MSSRTSRFLNLERARGDTSAAEGPVRLEGGGRFESMTGPGEPSEPLSVSVPEAHVERFKLQGQTPLALDDGPSEGQHFARCQRCETENGRFDSRCRTCGADLQAPEQLARDEARWRAREWAEAETLERMREQQRTSRASEQAAHEARLHQALEEDRSLASRIVPLFTPCLGVGLLRLIPHPLARWLTLTWTLILPVLLVRSGNAVLVKVGLYLGACVLLSFVPTALWRARRRRGE